MIFVSRATVQPDPLEPRRGDLFPIAAVIRSMTTKN
jgi:hypothetical protein